ncbi:6-phosphogluconolactonase, cycloisomerase 2 family [Pseudomonas asturiensis]|uniref:6-phosphogluconolactonase, cycloisomerase 2 family n=1 Tax=Pseudomonas asturiensis TaxID=1190415 RepID=A0A1M7MAK9_9PSED|nr:lactonase family protein [Pseudomonas asturiensis]SHM87317.1 6-phosphogluconolactonase, cycloisomerase 2 family [Pseudomonas asturiensis]
MPHKILPWLAMASAMSTFTLQAQPMTDSQLLLGSYTQGKSEGIYRFGFDSKTGMIDPKPLQVIKTENPSWLTVSKDQRYLFVVNENGPGQTDVVGKVSSFSIEPKTFNIAPINQVETKGEEPTHSSLSKDGRYLFVANYAVNPDPGGALSVMPVSKDGQLGDAVQVLPLGPGSKVNPERQMSSHVHLAVPTPDDKYVVTADLGADKLFVYRYNADQSKPLQPASIPSVQLPAGSGPRHVLFSGDGKHAWLVLEMSAQVVVFDYRDGVFKQTQIVDMKNKGVEQKNGGGALHTSPDGRFLYVTNRGEANQVVVFRIDPSSGRLEEIQRRAVEGAEPREFSFDPSGMFMLFANQKSNQIVTVRRDVKTGLIGDTVQKVDVDAPSYLHFLNEK